MSIFFFIRISASVLLSTMLTGCEIKIPSPEEQSGYYCKADFKHRHVAGGTLHSFEARLSYLSSEAMNCEELELNPNALDLLMRSVNENGEEAGVYSRCSEQPGCSMEADLNQYPENEGTHTNSCSWAIMVEGFLFDEEGSVSPRLVHEEEEIYCSVGEGLLVKGIQIREIDDLWVSFNRFDTFDMVNGLIGVLHASFVDEDGIQLAGGEFEFDFEDAQFLETQVELAEPFSSSCLTEYDNIPHVKVEAESAGTGSVTVQADTFQEHFEKTIEARVYDESEINGVGFFGVGLRNQMLPLGFLNYSLSPVANDEVELVAASGGGITLTAMLFSQDGNPVFPNHIDRIQYTLSYGAILEFQYWNDWASEKYVLDTDDNPVFALPDILTIIPDEAGTASIDAAWGEFESTLTIQVTDE